MVENTIKEILERHSKEITDKVAFHFVLPAKGKKSITFRDLQCKSESGAVQLIELGVKKGDKCLLIFNQGFEFIIAFFACQQIGAIPVPLNIPGRNKPLEKWEKIARDCKPTIILTGEATEKLGDTFKFSEVLNGITLAVLVSETEKVLPEESKAVHELAFLQYTSGSTGSPKGVMVTQYSLMANLEALKVQFGFDTESVMISWLPFYHDMGLILGILECLYVGGTSVLLIPGDFMSQPLTWLKAITDHEGTHTAAPNFAYELVTDKLKNLKDIDEDLQYSLKSLKVAVCGAEPVHLSTMSHFTKTGGKYGLKENVLKPGYGLAEGTLIVSSVKEDQSSNWISVDHQHLAESKITIKDKGKISLSSVGKETKGTIHLVSNGTVVDKHQISIRDPKDCTPLTSHQIGEVWYSGPSVTKGYYANEEATQKAFIQVNNTNYLRTGDLGFLDDRQELYLTGRIKDVIIIRGLNHYPQDIERTAFSCDHHLRKDGTAAFSIKKDHEEKLIIVQEVTREAIQHPDFAQWGKKIMDEILRIYGIVTESILFIPPMHVPRTTSGKIQRSRAKDQFLNGSWKRILHQYERSNYEYPYLTSNVKTLDQRSDFIEVAEAKVFVEQRLNTALGLEEGEIEDNENLLLYGIDSILVARLLDSWRNELNIPLKPAAFLENPTIHNWATQIFETSKEEAPQYKENLPFVAYPEDRHQPFQLTEVQNAYWVGRNPEIQWGGYSCYGYMEVEAGVLHTEKFTLALQQLVDRHEMLRCVIGSDGQQKILQEVNFRPGIYKNHEIADSSLHLSQIRSEMRSQTFAFDHLMFDVRLTETSPQNWLIHFGLDFMIADALSINIFWKDLHCLYKGDSLPKLEVSFRDYAFYLTKRKSGSHYQQCKNYWESRINAFPEAPKVPVINVNKENEFKGFKRFEKVLDTETWKAFTASAASQNLTPSAALLTLYSEILSAWGSGSHFGVMLTVFERENVHPQINDVLGDFTQLVLLEVNRKHQSIAKNGQALQWQMQEDLAHAAYSAVDEVKAISRLKGTTQLYPFVFTSALGLEGYQEGNNVPYFGPAKNLISQTPQVWLDAQVSLKNGQICLSWDCYEEIFAQGVLAAMFESYIQLVHKVALDPSQWNETIMDARPAVQVALHHRANETKDEQDKQLLHEGILENAQQAKDKLAVVCAGKSHTYQDLVIRANQFSAGLQKRGLKTGDHVAVQLPKSLDIIAAVIGVLQAGGVYVPIQYDNPANRTTIILKQSDTRFIISEREDTFEEVQVEQISTDLAENKSDIWKKPTIEPDSTAYIIFTSGSTGVPKGVEISHAAAMNTILDVNRRFSVTSDDCVLGISSLSFDLSVYDIFGVLRAGGTLVLPTEAERIDPKCWYRLSKDCGVTLWNSVPAILGLYVDYINKNPEIRPDMTIGQVFLSGDWIPLGLREKMAQALPNARMISMGGATEASIWSNYHEVTEIKPEWASIPYGYPLANQSFYVLDEFGRSCPDWAPGKLHIAGDGLAKGYYNAKELTDKAFFIHPELQIRLYATGDYGRYTYNGELEFLGRQDNQLKINGYRVEIGEIKAAFLKHNETLDPVILPIGGHMQSKKLIAFVLKSSVDFSEDHLKSALAHYLPPYFIPEKILAIDQYPQTANGKVDVKALQELYENEARVEPSTPQATTINHHPVLKTMQRVFELPELKPSDHFASIGVSSIDIIQLSNQLEADFGDRPAVGDMIQYESVNDLLAYYDNQGITYEEESEVAPIHPQFLLFSSSQMAYLKQLDVIDRPEPDTFYQNGVSHGRNNLKVQKCISFSDDKLAVNTHIKNRYSIARFSDQAVSQKDFAQFLSLCFTRYSSAQNFHNNLMKSVYPLQFYLSVFKGKVDELAQGNYYLDVEKKELLQLLDSSSTLIRTNDPDSLKNCAFVVHLVADLDVVYPIYAERTLPVCYTESGITSQQLSTEALQFSIGLQQLTDYDFEQEKADFQLTDQHFYLHSIAVGSIDPNQEDLSGGNEIPEWKNEEATLKGLLEQCESKRVKLWEEDGKLKFKAPEGAMNKDMQGRLKEHKKNLIPFLVDKRIQEEAQAKDPALQPFELTPIQWAYVSGRGKDFELGNVGAHFYTEIECESIETQAFENALNKIIAKHEALRTIISEDGTQQVMLEAPYYRVEEQTITQEKQIHAIREEWSHHLYTIGQWPMFHFQISRFPDESKVRLHVSIDLLIIDAWSGYLMLSEIFMEIAGEPVPRPNVTFKDYIQKEKEWHKKNYRFVEKAQAYWNNQVETLPEAPSLPYRKPLSQIENPKFSRWQFEISKEDMKNFTKTANEVNATVTAAICTAFMKTLSSWASQDELTLNLTLFNRLPLHKDAMQILGDFTNVAFITWKSHPNVTFQEEVNRIQKQLWLAIEHRAQNGLNLLREIGKDQPRKAIMPVVFTSLLSGKSAEEATIFPEGLKEVYAISQTPQVAIDHHAYRRGGNFIINWDLVEDAFDTGQLKQIFGRYEALIRQIITSSDWDKLFKF
ncbi:MAG: amino acid adenylation domain-containing protein [Bacteroidota bacterium]